MANTAIRVPLDDNECEAVMGSLLAIKYFKGKFKARGRHIGLVLRTGTINGRNSEILLSYGIEADYVAEQWPKSVPWT